jgi:hypothetical protein
MLVIGREMAAIEEAHRGAAKQRDQARMDQLCNRIDDIEREISELVSPSLEGIFWQAETLKSLSEFKVENDDHLSRCHDALIDNIITGLKRLSGNTFVGLHDYGPAEEFDLQQPAAAQTHPAATG